MKRLRAVLLFTVALGLVLTASAAAVAPSVSITSGPDNPTNSDDATFTFTVDDPLATVECKVDDGAFGGCTDANSHTANNLADGEHTFTVRATNTLGEVGQDSRTWTIDTVPPNTTIDSGPSGTVNSGSATFTFSGAGAFDCQLDGGGFTACNSGSTTYSNLDDGSHTFRVRAVDAAGNEDPTPAERTWIVDASAPTISIGQKPSNPSSDPTPTFGFTSDESNVTFWCSLDGSPAAQCDNPKTYSNVGAGSHTFRVFAVDSAGNSGNEASYTWTVGFPPVNEVRPTIEGSAQEGRTLTANPGQWSGTGTPTFAYLWQRCNEGGGGCENAGTGKTHLLNDEDVDHKMKVTVTATNAFGDASESSNLVPAEGVVSDVTAPQIHLSRTPADVTRRRSAVFAFTSDDRHARFMCKRDRQLAFWPCTSPVVFRRLRAGEHVFYVQATDRSGETSNHDHPWTIDRTPPPRPAGFVLRGGDRRVVATWTNPNVGDFAFVRVVRAGSPNVVVYQGRKTRFRDRKVRNGKRYVYKIRAFDRAGNRSKRIKRVIRPRDPLFSPREGQRIRIQRPPLFRWKADRSARSYNVQLHYRTAKGWRKIQSVFPTQARYQLPSRWRYDGRRQRFKRGLYVVHVWPWYGSRFGRLIGTNTFRGV